MLTKPNQFDPHAYTISLKRINEDGEDMYYAHVSEIPDISAYGDTHSEVYDQVIEALTILQNEAASQGRTFPKPFNTNNLMSYSGRVTLRMSKSMHGEVAKCAEEDGVSLNQWIIEAISQRRGFNVNTKNHNQSLTFSSKVLNLINSSMVNPSVQFGQYLENSPLHLSSSDEQMVRFN